MRRGFTLIELLIVMAIIAVLMGILTPIVSSASRMAKRSATRALLMKIDTALNQFKLDVGAFPYLDPPTGPTLTPDNRLAYHLGHDLTAAEVAAIQADATTAERKYDAAPHRVPDTQLDNRGVYLQVISQGGWQGNDFKPLYTGIVNRMARCRARLAVLSGNTGVRGLRFGTLNNSSLLLLPTASSTGWTGDYLGNDLSPKARRNDTIIDPYGTPLIYVCPVQPGQQGSLPNQPLNQLDWHSAVADWPVDETWYGMGPQGRAATTILASDIRTTAAAAWRFAPEVWSAGPDRRFAPQRDDRDNRDNLAVKPYLQGLQ
jgi:prepilin-type N-terminal cleavage/methylation domain-containing protein